MVMDKDKSKRNHWSFATFVRAWDICFIYIYVDVFICVLVKNKLFLWNCEWTWQVHHDIAELPTGVEFKHSRGGCI